MRLHHLACAAPTARSAVAVLTPSLLGTSRRIGSVQPRSSAAARCTWPHPVQHSPVRCSTANCVMASAAPPAPEQVSANKHFGGDSIVVLAAAALCHVGAPGKRQLTRTLELSRAVGPSFSHCCTRGKFNIIK
jgi:hypothetical protein